jgi:hypothetical protein
MPCDSGALVQIISACLPWSTDADAFELRCSLLEISQIIEPRDPGRDARDIAIEPDARRPIDCRMVSIDRLALAGAPSARTSVSYSAPQQLMDSQQGELAWPLASGAAGMHSSPPLIGKCRSLPSCNRLDSISLLGSLKVSALWCMGCRGFFSDERH